MRFADTPGVRKAVGVLWWSLRTIPGVPEPPATLGPDGLLSGGNPPLYADCERFRKVVGIFPTSADPGGAGKGYKDTVKGYP
ncbi:MAG: hypothetical protein MPK62_01290 [Alphaproteobacteria bacterium]|nr:hypothetical protein [Alphaproteobacteria bacterium]